MDAQTMDLNSFRTMSMPLNEAGPGRGVRSMESQHRQLLFLRAKVVVVGEACVGKTALTQMFHSGGHNYPKNYIMTIGVEFCVKQVTIPDTNVAVELYMFDCAGQGIFNQLDQNAKHWENAAFIFLVYDVSKRESFESCGKWLQGVRAARPSSSTPLPGVLVANKIDLREGGGERVVVDSQEGMHFAQENGLEYFETSALRATDIDAPFTHLANQFHQSYADTIAEQTYQTPGFGGAY